MADRGAHSAGRVLHVFKDIVKDPQQVYLGSTKDIRGRTEFLTTAGIEYDELAINQDNAPDAAVLAAFTDMPIDKYETVIFEHSIFPKSIQYLNANCPQLNILFRGHNAECYHRLHYALGAIKYGSLRDSLKWFKESLKKYREDARCARFADYVLSITAWESEHYWPKFTNADKVITAPFYLTDFYLGEIQNQSQPRSNRCLCLMSTFIGPFLYDALHHYQKLVSKCRRFLPGWDFDVTGKIPKKWRNRAPDINYLGLVDSPLDILCASRAMCVLSDLGYGFKTKILEAIMCGCYVLVPEKLFRRLPGEIKPFCKIVDLKSPESFVKALDETLEPFPDFDPNTMLKSTAFTNYAFAFKLNT